MRIAVIAAGLVKVTVHEKIDMIAVRDLLMAAARSMGVIFFVT